jgi:hypothetical protein
MADPGSGERRGTRHFTLKIQSISKISNLKNFTVNLKDLLEIGHPLDPCLYIP